MKKYKYVGTITTGNTLEVNGEAREAMLFPGREAELPEGDPWVARLIRRGYLVAVEAKAEKRAKAQTAATADTGKTKEGGD